MICKLEDLSAILNEIERAEALGVRIFLLNGELGVGKTTLIQAYIKRHAGLCATSPTFNIMNIYGNIYHYDLYMHSAQKLLEIGFLELLESGMHFIEWGERVRSVLTSCGYNFATINIRRDGDANLYEMTIHG